MSLKVVGAGLGRTGTHSLKIGLEKLLGEPCYHMLEIFNNPTHVGLWHDAALGKPVNWDELFTGYGAAVDWPASAFWPELSSIYPDALIVLSVRDAEAWWDSAKDTIFPRIGGTGDSEERKRWLEMVQAVLGSRFTMDVQNKQACIDAFNKHNDNVKATAPANRLLIWQATDGYEPLAKALGVPVPDEPFPLTNTKAEFIARLATLPK